MNKGISAALIPLLSLSLSLSHAQGVSHFHEELISGYRPLDSTVLMNSIVDAAHKYEGNDVPRFAQYDLAFPKDSAEYFELNGNAIVLIIGFTHDSTELPFSRAYLKSAFKEIELVKLFDTKLMYSNPGVYDLFGRHAIVSLYLLPIASMTNQPKLEFDWMKNRKAFSLGNLGRPHAVSFQIIPLQKKEIDGTCLKSFLLREFPLISN
jgi:hypothetical protein